MKAPSLRHCLAHLGFSPVDFDAVVAAGITSNTINPRQTHFCCVRGVGVQPTQCVVFEDADFGIQAAHAASMDTMIGCE